MYIEVDLTLEESLLGFKKVISHLDGKEVTLKTSEKISSVALKVLSKTSSSSIIRRVTATQIPAAYTQKAITPRLLSSSTWIRRTQHIKEAMRSKLQ